MRGRSETPVRPGVLGRLALVAAIGAYAFALSVHVWVGVSGRADSPPGERLSLLIAFGSFFLVGVVMAIRRPSHPIGWLFLGAGVYPTLQEALLHLGLKQMEGGDNTLFIFANTAFSWPMLLGVLVIFVPLFFPTGRLPSPRWKWLVWVAGGAMAAMLVGGLIQRDICVSYDASNQCVDAIRNPMGVPWLVSAEEGAFSSAMLGIVAISMVAALASVVVRYRRSNEAERTQLRWVVFAMALFIAHMLIVGILLEEVLGLAAELQVLSPFGIDPFAFFMALIPLSVGVAILRYRLYDIDRIISRTVAYGAVTALLVAGYAGAVVVFRAVLPGQNDLAVVASTLGVAALFNPVRRRVQGAVDRRFNRERYDAERIVDAFGQHLRSRSGIDDLGGDLMEAAVTTMQPATASLWLKGSKP